MNDQRLLLRIGLESFKSIARLDQDLGQLTVVVGENSAGKSSLLQSVVLMSQIARSDVLGSDIPLHGNELDLGDFKDIVHSGAAADEVTVSLTIRELPRASSEIGTPTGDAGVAGLGEFRWDVSLGVPYRRQRGASIRRLTLSSTVTSEMLSASPVDPRSGDSGEKSRAEDLRSMLARSIRLARAASDTSLELAARSAFERPDAPVFEGGVRPLRSPEDERLAATETRLQYVEVAGGLPRLALRAVGNKRVAAEAFLALSAPDYLMGTDDRAILAEAKLSTGDGGTDQFPDEELAAAFAQWYERLDEALRERDSFALPATDFELPHELLDPDELHALLRGLADIETPEVIERDHLSRLSTGAVGAAELVQDALARRVSLLGPLRSDPRPIYQAGLVGTGITPLGKKGEHAIAFLDEHADDLVICPLVPDPDDPDQAVHDERPLKTALEYWLRQLGIADRTQIQLLGKNLDFTMVDPQTRTRRDQTEVGVGASQVIPVLVLCLAARPGDLVLLEQPELHLHPRPQQVLGDFLLGIARTGRQLLVETHSEYLVNRLRLRMVEQRIDEQPELLKLLYAIRDKGATSFHELRPNALGAFEGGWPKGFFDQSPYESEQIVRAAAERRRAERAVQD